MIDNSELSSIKFFGSQHWKLKLESEKSCQLDAVMQLRCSREQGTFFY